MYVSCIWLFCVHSCTNSLEAQVMMLTNTMWSCIKAEPTLIWELSCCVKKRTTAYYICSFIYEYDHSLSNFTYVMYIAELPDDLMERIEQMSNRMNELNDLRAKVRVNFVLQLMATSIISSNHIINTSMPYWLSNYNRTYSDQSLCVSILPYLCV